MKVIALQRGYDNVTVREEGEVFDMPEGSKGTWFKPLKAAGKARGEAPAGDGKPDDGKDPSSLA